MAARTLTYTANMAEPARSGHVGVQAVTFNFNSGATKFGTVSDVALLGRIPNGCTVTGGYVRGRHGGADGAHFLLLAVNSQDYTKSGGTIKMDQANGSFTLTQTAASLFHVNGPIRISLSADATTSEAVLYLNCTTGASESVSCSLHGVIYYVNDGRAASE
jgi:hypothetical protein